MGDLFGIEPMLAIGGLAIIAALHFRNVKGSIIIGVLITAVGFFIANSSWPTRCGAGWHEQDAHRARVMHAVLGRRSLT